MTDAVGFMMRSKHYAPHVREVAKILSESYGDFDHYNRKNPLEELLFIICSIQTDERGYRATFRALRRRFPRFADLSCASEKSIASTIEKGGLSRQKASAIKKLMGAIVNKFGRPTLAPLRRMPDPACDRILASLPGVGKKTARCVTMYSLGRQVFPVDTHCWRICRRLGWVRRTRPDGSCSPHDMDRLQAKIPPDVRFSLHVNMVSLGRDVCFSQGPLCGACPIERLCRKIGARGNTSG